MAATRVPAKAAFTCITFACRLHGATRPNRNRRGSAQTKAVEPVWSQSCSKVERRSTTMLILLVVILLLVLGGGGGYYGHSRWGYGGGAGVGIGTILLILLLVYMLGIIH